MRNLIKIFGIILITASIVYTLDIINNNISEQELREYEKYADLSSEWIEFCEELEKQFDFAVNAGDKLLIVDTIYFARENYIVCYWEYNGNEIKKEVQEALDYINNEI